MSYTLYAALVPSYLQILRGASVWLDKAAMYAERTGKSEAEIMEARLAPDMLPFNRQVRGFAMHAQGGIEGVMKGVFSPDRSPAPATFAGLNARLKQAVDFLEELDPTTFELLVGKPMIFELGEVSRSFVGDQFLQFFAA